MLPKQFLERVIMQEIKSILSSQEFWQNIFQKGDYNKKEGYVLNDVNIVPYSQPDSNDITDNSSISVSISNI